MKLKLSCIILFPALIVISSCRQDSFKNKCVDQPLKMQNIKTNTVSFPDEFMTGSSYYPEQWPRSEWEIDFKKMQELGFNTVRMGEFAWALFEPQEGKFKFAWMDDAIALAAKYGIKTILCTPTANVPPWLHEKYPEVLGANSKGNFTLGGRKGYNVNSKEYIKASKRITTEMAVHFGQNPDIIGWQLDNEPGYPFELFDQVSLESFKIWLKNKYRTLDNLNKSWGGVFWNLNYSGWDQIEFPVNNGDGGWNPGQLLDYRRFFSDAFSSHLYIQSEILRKHIANRFIFTNWPNLYWSVDPFEAGAKYLDATGWDNYSKTPGLCDYRDLFTIGLNDDIARCATSKQKFFIAERQTQVAAHASTAALRTLAWIDLAHGSIGNIYFEWRSPTVGQEQGYESILQNDGSFGLSKEQYIRMKEEMAVLSPKLKDAKTISDIALVYSYQNQWEQGFWQRNQLGYDIEAERYYKALKEFGRNIDVIPETSELSSYKIVAIPGLKMLSERTFNKLENFVANGGILIVNKQCGTKDTLNQFRQILAPGLFRDIAGISIPAVSSKSSMSGNLISGKGNQMINQKFGIIFPDDNCEYEPLSIIELLELNGAKPLAYASGGELSGKPTVTLNYYKNGAVVYVGTDSDNPSFYAHLTKLLAVKFQIKPILKVPAGVDVMSRTKDKLEYIFILNYTSFPQAVTVPDGMEDQISNQTVKGKIVLEPFDTRVFTRKQ